MRPKALPSVLFSGELKRETKLELGLPTVSALRKKKKEREEEENDAYEGEACRSFFVDLALLPSPPAPAPPSALQEGEDDKGNDGEGPRVEALLLEEAVLGEEAKKKKRNPDDVGGGGEGGGGGSGSGAIPALLLLLPAVPPPCAAPKEPFFASIARSAILWTSPLPTRPKPALVDVAAAEYGHGDGGAPSSSSS